MRIGLLLAAFLVTLSCYAQQPLTMNKTFGGVQFLRDTVELSSRQVGDLLSVNPEALLQFKRAKVNSNVGTLLGVGGSALIAIPLVSAIVGNEPQWLMVAGGAGLLAASIPFNRAFRMRAGKAIELYNGQLPKARLAAPEFTITRYGATFRFRF